jgi:hypothetical protein
MAIIIGDNVYAGNNVTITGNKVYIDGKDVTPDTLNVSIVIDAPIDTLQVDYANKIEITGDVKKVETKSGNIRIKGNVSGDVQTSSGDVKCDAIVGNVRTSSGDVECSEITGNVSTVSGNVN